jgi:AcrR family transcriptional regulator
MGKNRFERKKEETKRKIVSVAMNLFKTQGFDSTTMEQIANEADIAKGTIYLHFPVKEAIISEYLESAVRGREHGIIQNMRAIPDTRSRLIVFYIKCQEFTEKEITRDLDRRYLLYVLQNLNYSVRTENLRKGLNGILTGIIEIGQEEGDIRKDVPAEILAEQLQSANFVSFLVWLINPEKFSLIERLTLNIDLFLDGAATAGGGRE